MSKTTLTTSSSVEMDCSFEDPSQTQRIRFYFHVDGTNTGPQEAETSTFGSTTACTFG